jgi:uncharacterized membrane protein
VALLADLLEDRLSAAAVLVARDTWRGLMPLIIALLFIIFAPPFALGVIILHALGLLRHTDI